MKKIGVFILVMLFSSMANAAFNGISHHSRANCGNNESISWDWTNNWWFWVNSDHLDARTGAKIHGLSSGWQLTWRNAMVHWGEGRGGWVVHGSHYMRDSSGRPQLVSDELVRDCSIYDGWWDRNK